MTATQSIQIYQLLQSYSIDKDEAKLIISEIEQVLSPNENNNISIKNNDLVFKNINRDCDLKEKEN
ncbi:MAG: hypothetical protein ABI184_10390 [Ginsengibacter sp.]